MSEAKTIARPYAVAAWRHAKAQGKVDLWADMLDFMSAVVTDRTLAGIVADPRVEAHTLSQLMLDICGGRINHTAEAFVKLLVENGKLSLLPEITEVFNERKAEAGGTINATLITAYPVNARFERALARAMQKKLDREVTFSVEEDKTLIGGVVIRAGDMVIDASVRGQIEALAAELRV